jgi:hypothetical protein
VSLCEDFKPFHVCLSPLPFPMARSVGRGRAPSAKRLAHVLIVRKHSDLSWLRREVCVHSSIGHRSSRAVASSGWYTAFGSVVRWCSHVFVMNTYMRAPPYAIAYWPWSSTMLSLSDWRWSDHCGDASHSELPLFVILCFFF